LTPPVVLRATLVLAALLCATVPAVAATTIPPPPVLHPAMRLELTYQLGYAVYAPVAAVLDLDNALKAKKITTDQMAALAEKTRVAESVSYTEAVSLLKQMDAPPEVVKPYATSAALLNAPLVIDASAQDQFPDDPTAQKVWATLDEADSALPSDNGLTAAWLKLSHGRDGLWAYHLGCLVAAARDETSTKPSNQTIFATAATLESFPPQNTPADLVYALQDVADQEQKGRVMPDVLERLSEAAGAVFEEPVGAAPPAHKPSGSKAGNQPAQSF
jgi:hypothetical protein